MIAQQQKSIDNLKDKLEALNQKIAKNKNKLKDLKEEKQQKQNVNNNSMLKHSQI